MCDLIKKTSISIFLTLLGSIVYAQTFSLKGNITDDTGRELSDCSVLLLTNGDEISVGTTKLRVHTKICVKKKIN